MNTITLTQFDQIQIFATAQALSCAKTGLFLAPPASIRHTALVWLDKVNVKVSPKAKWATLHKEFAEAFAPIIQKK